MNKNHQIALAAAKSWAEKQQTVGDENVGICFGIGFGVVYEACIYSLEKEQGRKPTIWQRLGFAQPA